jgi:hypothetical protein
MVDGSGVLGRSVFDFEKSHIGNDAPASGTIEKAK